MCFRVLPTDSFWAQLFFSVGFFRIFSLLLSLPLQQVCNCLTPLTPRPPAAAVAPGADWLPDKQRSLVPLLSHPNSFGDPLPMCAAPPAPPPNSAPGVQVSPAPCCCSGHGGAQPAFVPPAFHLLLLWVCSRRGPPESHPDGMCFGGFQEGGELVISEFWKDPSSCRVNRRGGPHLGTGRPEPRDRRGRNGALATGTCGRGSDCAHRSGPERRRGRG